MNQYLKIPRGINVVNTNDLILQRAIEEIGKQHSRVLFGTFRSNYAKGKAYLSQKYGISKTALKKLHKVKICTYGYINIGERYANYISIHILFVREIFENIIKCTKDKNIDLLEIAFGENKAQYSASSKYMEVLFGESMHQINVALRDQDNFNAFNKNDNAHTELGGVSRDLNNITEQIGG